MLTCDQLNFAWKYSRSKRKDTSMYLVVIFVVSTLVSKVSCEKQQFLIMPVDTTVVQGGTVVLKCVIQNLKGRVQWTKNGFVMGFYRGPIPGYPRFSVIGNENQGEWDLRIENAMLPDDDEYQCQVTPAGGDPPLWASAEVFVAVPPEQPLIGGQNNGTHLEVLPTQKTLDMTCESRNGKPGATLKWFKQGVPVLESAKTELAKLPNKLVNAKSILTIHPRREDDGSIYSCKATNIAQQTPLESIITLSVLHPPGDPVITGYETGKVVKVGDTVLLKCTSVGGNPPATVIWYRDGKEIDLSYTVGAGKAFNDFQFEVDATDNNVRYSCVAKNFVTENVKSTVVRMSVQFPPVAVKIEGKTSGISGETLLLECETTNSNPAAIIAWMSQGRQLTGDAQTSIPSNEGGFITRSTIPVTLNDDHDGTMYTCQATNIDLQVTRVNSVKLVVLYPPQKPVISGYRPGTNLAAGEPLRLTCTSVGGNPLATITWWKGNTKLASQTTFVSNVASNELSLILDESDNGAEYRCNVTNEAAVVPLIATIALTVQFRSNGVTIVAMPTVGRMGRDMSLTCTSESSNPASKITWWKNGRQIVGAGRQLDVSDARHGGQSTTNVWLYDPQPEDNGIKISCRATNEAIDQFFSDAFPLTVLYPPVFESPVGTLVSIVEGGSTRVNLTAHANPEITAYTWFKDGEQFLGSVRDPIRAEGASLIMEGIRRTHAGVYIAQAENEEGKTNFTLTVDVQFAAEIESITSPVYIDPGRTGKVECKVNGNPLDASMITWRREGFNFQGRALVISEEARSTMTLLNMTREDNGIFTCVADNKIGTVANGQAEVIVKYAPQIDRTAKHSKFAAEKMTTAHIICRAEGAPAISFTWEKNGRKLVTRDRYRTDTTQMDAKRWQGHLYIANVTDTDYMIYTCTANNLLGQDSAGINFIGTTRPDPPEDFRFVNASHDTVYLAWNAGFSGGLVQTYRIRYREYGIKQYKFTDVEPPGTRIFGIKGLKLKTRYEFWIMAMNKLGASDLSSISAVAMTTTSRLNFVPEDVPKDSKLAQGDEGPLIIILVVCAGGMLLLALNVILILYMIRKRQRKQQKQQNKEHANTNSAASGATGGVTTNSKAGDGCSPSNAVEMYAPPEYGNRPACERTYSSYDRSLDDFNDDLYKAHYPDEILPLKNGPYSPSKSDASSLGTDSPHVSLINNKHRQHRPVNHVDDYEAHNRGGSVTLPRSGLVISNDEQYRNARNADPSAGPDMPAYHSNSLSRTSRYPPPPPVRSSSSRPPRGPLRPMSPLRHLDGEEDARGDRLGHDGRINYLTDRVARTSRHARDRRHYPDATNNGRVDARSSYGPNAVGRARHAAGEEEQQLLPSPTRDSRGSPPTSAARRYDHLQAVTVRPRVLSTDHNGIRGHLV